MQKQNKYFVTIEGVEGAGKTTAMQIISKFLDQNQIAYVLTREPGGTKIAEQIRELLLCHSDEPMHQDTELLLYFAGRAQHIAQLIKPALAAGKWVVSDRFTDASYAYQGIGRSISHERIAILENWVQGNLRPDLTILLDLPPEDGLQRVKKTRSLDRIESEKIDFFHRVRQCYLDMAANNSGRYRIVDALQPVAAVEKQIVEILSTRK